MLSPIVVPRRRTLQELLEIISKKSPGKYVNKARMLSIHHIENLNKALRFIKFQGLKLVNIGAADIQTGTPTCILGLIWTLILRYQINKVTREGDDASYAGKIGLMTW